MDTSREETDMTDVDDAIYCDSFPELEFLSSLSTPVTVYLQIAHLTIKILFGDELVAEGVRKYFTEFVCPNSDFEGENGAGKHIDLTISAVHHTNPCIRHELLLEEPREKSIKQSYYVVQDVLVVYRVRTNIAFYIRRKSSYVVGDLHNHGAEVRNLIGYAYNQSLRGKGYTCFHASAVSYNGNGLAFAGSPGSGKTTLSLSFLEMGFDFVTNDRILVKQKGEDVYMSGVPKWPTVNPGTLCSVPHLKELLATPERQAYYDSLTPDVLWHLEEKYPVRVSQVYGKDRLCLWTKLKTLCILTWKSKFKSHSSSSHCHKSAPAPEVSIRRVPPGSVGMLVAGLIKHKLTDPCHIVPPSVMQLNAMFKHVTVLHVSGCMDVATFMQKVSALPSPMLPRSLHTPSMLAQPHHLPYLLHSAHNAVEGTRDSVGGTPSVLPHTQA